jgi:hypothetical protein
MLALQRGLGLVEGGQPAAEVGRLQQGHDGEEAGQDVRERSRHRGRAPSTAGEV